MLKYPGYFLPVDIRQSAATASGATVWAVRATIGSATIRKIYLQTFFDATLGTPQVRYDLKRFSTATPTGGTAISVIEANNAMPATAGVDARFLDTGLTVAGVVFEAAWAFIRGSGNGQGVGNFVWEFPEHEFHLLNGEGLAIQLGVTATIGQGIAGYVYWHEQTGAASS